MYNETEKYGNCMEDLFRGQMAMPEPKRVEIDDDDNPFVDWKYSSDPVEESVDGLVDKIGSAIVKMLDESKLEESSDHIHALANALHKVCGEDAILPEDDAEVRKDNRVSAEILDVMTLNGFDTLDSRVNVLNQVMYKIYAEDKTTERFIFLDEPLSWLYIVKNQFNNNRVTYVFKFDGLPEPLIFGTQAEISKIRAEVLQHGIVIKKPKIDAAINAVFESQAVYNQHTVSLVHSPLRIHQATFKAYHLIQRMLDCENALIAESNLVYQPDEHIGMHWKTRSGNKVICITEEVFSALINSCATNNEESLDTILTHIDNVVKGKELGEESLTADEIAEAKTLLRDCKCLHMNNGDHIMTKVSYLKGTKIRNDEEIPVWEKRDFLVIKDNKAIQFEE